MAAFTDDEEDDDGDGIVKHGEDDLENGHS